MKTTKAFFLAIGIGVCISPYLVLGNLIVGSSIVKIDFPGPLTTKIGDLAKESSDIPHKKHLILNTALKQFNDLHLKSHMYMHELANVSTYELNHHHGKHPAYFDQPFKNNHSVKITNTPTIRYTYDDYTAFWADFANLHLGGGIFGNGFVQEEIMCCEMPELANAAAWAATQQPKVVTRSGGSKVKEGSPVPLVFVGVHRVMEIDLDHPSFYGHLEAVTYKQLEKKLKLKKPAQEINILAIAAPLIDPPSPQEATSLDTIEDLFNTFVAGFQLAKDVRGGSPTLINTGPIGTGAFHNNRYIVYVLQRLAAHQVGVDLKFWAYPDDVVKKATNDYYNKIKKDGTVKQLLQSTHDIMQNAPGEKRGSGRTSDVMKKAPHERRGPGRR